MIRMSLIAGWTGILLGVLCGAVIGLFFHDEGWLGGYGSFPRRLVRLGHISFFGLGFVNVFYALTGAQIHLGGMLATVASVALLVGAVTMPLCCFLTAWRKPLRHLFPIPVAAVTIGIAALLIGLAHT